MDIDVNGIKIHYEVLGEGKTIIILNPNNVNTSIMRSIGRKLSKNFKVYLVDRRCCGKSTRNCELTYEESANDIYKLINKLNLDKPYVLGSSGGASVLLYLASMYPDSISKIVLCSGVARKEKVKLPDYSLKMRKLKWYPGKKNVEKFFQLVENARDLTEEDLRKIKAKTLVVNGGVKDIVSVEEAKYLANNIKDSKLLILEKENHGSYIRNCNRWYEKLIEFLNE